ncbi:MAG: glycosyltransferase [Thermoplasmata archaeon]|nr:glycosyltransferase [Thermoplasmata archaeon]
MTVLSRSPKVDQITAFVPRGSAVPPAAVAARLTLRPTWAHDDLGSLVRTLLRMLRAGPRTDLYLFNIYVTSFGRNPIVNAFGLMMPVALARWTRKPVRVYMHNFLETQDVEQLGYRPSPWVRRVVRWLERRLIGHASVVVALASQGAVVEREVGGHVEPFILPYIETMPSIYARLSSGAALAPAPVESTAPVRVLLFGVWGPQKDLGGALDLLKQVQAAGERIQVTVAGGANPSFPEYAAEISKFEAAAPKASFRFLGWVSEDDVLALTLEQDLLFLPYRATGGYSGAMNCGALTDLPVVAYDLPQLREFAQELGVSPTFIDPARSEQLAAAVQKAAESRAARTRLARGTIEARLETTGERVDRLATAPVSSTT